mmetsp:Transcript_7763/g.18944  ORF Transcript_7763/g.18944 Transcript_7763/m.18944 type:complete len:142 (+) Transcript_7763:2094-2519(+)
MEPFSNIHMHQAGLGKHVGHSQQHKTNSVPCRCAWAGVCVYVCLCVRVCEGTSGGALPLLLPDSAPSFFRQVHPNQLYQTCIHLYFSWPLEHNKRVHAPSRCTCEGAHAAPSSPLVLCCPWQSARLEGPALPTVGPSISNR